MSGTFMRFAALLGGASNGFLLARLVRHHRGDIDGLIQSIVPDAPSEFQFKDNDRAQMRLLVLVSVLVGVLGSCNSLLRGWTQRSGTTNAGRALETMLYNNFLLFFFLGATAPFLEPFLSGDSDAALVALRISVGVAPLAWVLLRVSWAWLELGAGGGGRFGAAAGEAPPKNGKGAAGGNNKKRR